MATWTRESGAGASSSAVLKNLVEDTSPVLGGNLDVKSFIITTSTANGDIQLTPNGSGKIIVTILRTIDLEIAGTTTLESLPTTDPASTGRLFTQTAAELGGSGTTKVLCVSP